MNPFDQAWALLKMPQEARRFAEEQHEGQMYGEEPYMTHVDEVASQFDDPHMQRIAYLHDTVEDTPTTLDDIHERFGEDVGHAVDALTRRKDPNNQGGKEVYTDYIKRLAQHPEARQVKIADLKHNLSGRSKGNLRQRHEKALEMLS
jgi:(p)ppGpp synthase/HD superfamily hydrolase